MPRGRKPGSRKTGAAPGKKQAKGKGWLNAAEKGKLSQYFKLKYRLGAPDSLRGMRIAKKIIAGHTLPEGTLDIKAAAEELDRNALFGASAGLWKKHAEILLAKGKFKEAADACIRAREFGVAERLYRRLGDTASAEHARKRKLSLAKGW